MRTTDSSNLKLTRGHLTVKLNKLAKTKIQPKHFGRHDKQICQRNLISSTNYFSINNPHYGKLFDFR